MGRLSASDRDNIARDVEPVAREIERIAGKYGLRPATIARHALLRPGRIMVPIVSLKRWNASLREGRTK